MELAMRPGTGIFALALALAVPATAHAVSVRTYVNERFGSTADVPTDWTPGEAPDNGDGLRFTSPDGQAWIVVSGGRQVWDSVGEAMAILESPNEGEQITYRHRETRLVVVSGLKRDRIFYRKSILSCRDTVWNNVAIEYPAARKQVFDAIVVQVAKSLRPGKSIEVAECNDDASSSRVTLISTGTLQRSDQANAPAQGSGTSSRNTLTRQASAESRDEMRDSQPRSAAPPQDQDMQRSDDMQSSHSDM
jgi:serine/threonine-protein kinase